ASACSTDNRRRPDGLRGGSRLGTGDRDVVPVGIACGEFARTILRVRMQLLPDRRTHVLPAPVHRIDVIDTDPEQESMADDPPAGVLERPVLLRSPRVQQ